MTDRTQKEATRTVDEPNGEAPRDPAPRQDDKLFVEFSAAASGHFGVADSSALSSAGNRADLRADMLQGAASVRHDSGAGSHSLSAPPAAAGLPEEIGQANQPSISTADPTASSNLAQQRAGLSDAGTRSLDLPAGRTRPDAGAVSSAQLTSPSSAVQAPAAQPLNRITIETPQFTAASPSADAAGSAPQDISGFGRALDLNSDGLGQAIATAAWPRSAGDGRDAPLRSAPASTEDRIHPAIPDLLPNVPIVETGNTVPGGPTVEASAPSSASSVLPTGLSDQVLHHVIGSIDNGGGQVVLRLHPPELGDLAVRILVNGRDVSAWFASPQIQVQQAISQAIGQLRVDLGSLGYNLAGTSVGAEAWSFWEPEEGSLPQQGALHRSRPERSSAEPSPSVSSGVSIYV
jgi:flagellar hook-length control protein FliK